MKNEPHLPLAVQSAALILMILAIVLVVPLLGGSPQ